MTTDQKKHLIVITGPTGIGKTGLSLDINRHFNTNIISADSRQVYKELSIGTAKPSIQEIKDGGIVLVDHVSIHDPYNVGHFESEALNIIARNHLESDYSILCGGTGLYIKAVTEGLHEFPDVTPEILKELKTNLEENGIEELQNKLLQLDPEYHEQVDLNNAHRLIRALSIIEVSGQKFSSFFQSSRLKRTFNIINIVLDLPREDIYKRINDRVLKMIKKGLIEECSALRDYKHLQALNTVGYKEVFEHLDGQLDLNNCISEIQKNTRRYAKRQLTWLRKYNSGPRFKPSESEKILAYIKTFQNS